MIDIEEYESDFTAEETAEQTEQHFKELEEIGAVKPRSQVVVEEKSQYQKGFEKCKEQALVIVQNAMFAAKGDLVKYYALQAVHDEIGKFYV